MPHYTITATVSVDVEMTIKASSEKEARELFKDHVIVSASLIDVPANKFDVSEDSISEVADVRVLKAC